MIRMKKMIHEGLSRKAKSLSTADYADYTDEDDYS